VAGEVVKILAGMRRHCELAEPVAVTWRDRLKEVSSGLAGRISETVWRQFCLIRSRFSKRCRGLKYFQNRLSLPMLGDRQI
jgi:hypothetical protein